MSALPVISTAVSALGVVSTINQQRQAANLQASAIDDERTNAIIQSELSAAQQHQQHLIASTMNDIERRNTQVNAELMAKQANVTFEEYQSQLEQARLALDTQEELSRQNTQAALSQLEQQRLTSDSEALKQQASTISAINQAQEQAATLDDEDLNFASRVAMANRLNRLGISTKQQEAMFDEELRKRKADVDELEQDKQAVKRFTEETLAQNQRIQEEMSNVANLEQQRTEEALRLGKEQLSNDASTAQRTLSEFQMALKTALESGMSDADLQRFLIEQSKVAGDRARELGLSAQIQALNNQAKSIQRPGLFDLLAGGLNVFQQYSAMKQQQERIATINQKTAQIENRRLAPPDAVSPYYNPSATPFSKPTPTEGLQIPDGSSVNKTNTNYNYWLNKPAIRR